FGYFKTKLEFGSTYVFHSFRHTFQNKLKQLDIEFEKINELVGHGANDENKITDDYTYKYNLDILSQSVEKINFKNSTIDI
ncbi:MAG: hypothetical protein U9N59_00365, partial [Campylobacterota bacterium]|nr:hypothetical protein [Campylobacterota bacterium]